VNGALRLCSLSCPVPRSLAAIATPRILDSLLVGILAGSGLSSFTLLPLFAFSKLSQPVQARFAANSVADRTAGSAWTQHVDELEFAPVMGAIQSGEVA
jgi:hypothetical protein